uniref:Potassium voltage-gated channel subfamily E regulatory subunit 5 n=1 Tax=Sus scrofa TaxID=9823 RepID=A0A4X1W5E2_PIG
MNCSESQRLRTLLSRLLLELHHQGNASGLGAGPGPSVGMGVVPDPFVGREVTSAKGDDAYLYILLIMIFYACLAGGLILAYTRSRKLVEAKDEPSPACAQHEWVSGGAPAAADAETAAGSPAEGCRLLAPAGLPAPALARAPEGSRTVTPAR